MLSIYKFDPTVDCRWPKFVDRRQDASVFHTAGWLKALRDTYGYEPVGYTTTPFGEDLRDGVLVCRIDTWLSTKRLVSLPFSDHAAPLIEDHRLGSVLTALVEEVATTGCRYLEIRPVRPLEVSSPEFCEAGHFLWHKLSLEKNLEALFNGFHKSCIQRKIRRAKREGLKYEEGRTPDLVQKFYRLLLLTHRRHGIPPQPIGWFLSLSKQMEDKLKVRVASKNGIPIASIITITHGQSMVYKYGGSAAEHHNMGGMPFLMWHAIQDAKECNLKELDLGRTDSNNQGLATFKENWGAESSTLTYWGFPAGLRPDQNGWHLRAARSLVSCMPKAVLPVFGRLAYRHMG